VTRRLSVVLVTQAGQHAVAGQPADAGAAAAVAEQAKRIARGQPESGIQRTAPEVPAGAGSLFPGGFQVKQGFDLAAALVPDRNHRAVLAGLGLRIGARDRGEGDHQGQR